MLNLIAQLLAALGVLAALLKDLLPSGARSQSSKIPQRSQSEQIGPGSPGVSRSAAALHTGQGACALDLERRSRIRKWLPLALLLLALAVRLWRFGSVPGGMNQDGAMAAVDARALAYYGTDRYGMSLPVHFTAWGYGQMSVLMSYLMAPFVRLFGLSPLVARIPTLCVSMAGLVFLWLFVRDAFGEKSALWVLFFAAVDPWHFLQSRWALDCNLLPHVFVAGLYCLGRGAAGYRRCLWISMVLFALCLYCYGIALYTVPLFLLFACLYLLLSKRIRIREALICLGIWLLFAWPFLLTMAINYFGWDTVTVLGFTMARFPDSIRSGSILFFADDIPAQLKTNIAALWRILIRQSDGLVWNAAKGFGTIYLFSLPFSIAGLWVLCRERKEPAAVLSLLFLLTGLAAGILTNSVNINRGNLLFYPLILLTGLGFAFCAEQLRPARFGIPVLYLLAFALFINTYFTSYAEEIADAFMADFGAAVTSVKNAEAEHLYITADAQHRGYANVSEILTLFYHETDAKYYQGETPEGEVPFREKYTFRSIDRLTLDPRENAVYVIASYDLPLFDPALFSVESFGDFAVARPLFSEPSSAP